MTFIGRDPQAFRAIQFEDVRDYLKTVGWSCREEIKDKFEIWYLGDTKNEVIVPLKSTFSDYAIRMSELVSDLSKIQNRSQHEILADIESTSHDVIRLHLDNPLWANGTIILADGLHSLEKAHEMIVSAARAADADVPRAVYYGNYGSRVQSFLETVRMGQTEHGSFVFTFKNSIPRFEMERNGQIDLEKVPFSRQVSYRLFEALGETQKAALEVDRSGDISRFQDSISYGVSANLCESIAGVVGTTDGSAIDVGITWARSRETSKQSVTKVRFDSSIVPILREAAQYFRHNEPQPDFTIEGHVVALDRAEGDSIGKIKVSCMIEKKWKKIWIELENADYVTALACHEKKIPISCTGDLERDGRSWVLTNPKNILQRDEDRDE
jgi:hypothetical protein